MKLNNLSLASKPGIAAIAGGIAWTIGRSIGRPLGQLGPRTQALADGSLAWSSLHRQLVGHAVCASYSTQVDWRGRV